MNLLQLILLAFPIYFLSLWCLVLWLLALASGWRNLTETYHHPEPFHGERLRFQSAKVGWVSFNNALTIGISEQGLYLVPMVLFRAFFKPLLIPWGEIRVESLKRIYLTFRRLTFASVPNCKIDLSERTFERITLSLQQQSDTAEPRPGAADPQIEILP